MLGAQPQVIESYVETGQLQIVFWPVLNYGEPSFNATVAAECAARQDMNAFWDLHRDLFENQSDLWRAGRDYYVQAAQEAGVDAEAFGACFDGEEARNHVQALDEARQARGIFSQPVFDIEGQLLHGSQSFETFAGVIDGVLEE